MSQINLTSFHVEFCFKNFRVNSTIFVEQDCKDSERMRQIERERDTIRKLKNGASRDRCQYKSISETRTIQLFLSFVFSFWKVKSTWTWFMVIYRRRSLLMLHCARVSATFVTDRVLLGFGKLPSRYRSESVVNLRIPTVLIKKIVVGALRNEGFSLFWTVIL